MTLPDDPLWDPTVRGDAELARLQALLRPFGAQARGLDRDVPAFARPRRGRRAAAVTGALAMAAALVIAIGLQHRLAWDTGRAWSTSEHTVLAPGDRISAGPDAALVIDAARIGRIVLSPDSTLRLLETRAGHHRVALDRGHLHARIWAPPGYFGVRAGGADVIDLGCEFDVWRDGDAGRVRVQSGWIAYRHGAHDVLVPAGFEIRFAGDAIATPVRVDASAAFTAAVAALDAALLQPASADRQTAIDRLVSLTTDADGYTLLSLLTQHPALASSALYPRAAYALGAMPSASHRAAWKEGDTAAIDAWWDRLPRQPKTWWLNWNDAF